MAAVFKALPFNKHRTKRANKRLGRLLQEIWYLYAPTVSEVFETKCFFNLSGKIFSS